jgi:hypothetical protein
MSTMVRTRIEHLWSYALVAVTRLTAAAPTQARARTLWSQTSVTDSTKSGISITFYTLAGKQIG